MASSSESEKTVLPIISIFLTLISDCLGKLGLGRGAATALKEISLITISRQIVINTKIEENRIFLKPTLVE